ncbi:hypothetical protein BGZ58_005828, partial [Dissophora ornata]
SKPNQFRPVFEAKDSLLSGRTINLDTVRRHSRPQPRRGPKTKQSKRASKKKKEKKKRKWALPKKAKSGGDSRRPGGATKRDRGLRRRYQMKTLTVGCIKANAQRSLSLDSAGSSSSSASTSSAAVHTAETDAACIAQRLRLCVGVINKIQIHVFEAIALDIATLVRPDLLGQESNDDPQGAGSASRKGKQGAEGELLGAGVAASSSLKGKRKAEDEPQDVGTASRKGKQRAEGELLSAGAAASSSLKGKRKAEDEPQDEGTASRKGKQRAKGEPQGARAMAGSSRKGKRKAEADPGGLD